MKHIVTIGEAAILLGVCTKTIRRWDFFGKIRCFRTPGGHRRITLIEIEQIKNGLPLNQRINYQLFIVEYHETVMKRYNEIK